MNLQIVHTQKPHWGWPKKISFGRFSAGWGTSYFRISTFTCKFSSINLLTIILADILETVADILKTELAVYYLVKTWQPIWQDSGF